MVENIPRIAVGINSENNSNIYKRLLKLHEKGTINALVFKLLIASFKDSVFKEISEEKLFERIKELPEDFDYDSIRHKVVDKGSLQEFRTMLDLDHNLTDDISPADKKAARKTQAVVFFLLKKDYVHHSIK